MSGLYSIWFLYFVNAFQSTVFSSLSPYVASSFTAHSLSGVPTALADAFSAAIYIPVGKMMDTWGRAEGFLVMTCFATLGLVLLAACDSFAIYCTAYVSLLGRLCCFNEDVGSLYTNNPRSSTISASVVWSIPLMSSPPMLPN
jgi:MFS family permease